MPSNVTQLFEGKPESITRLIYECSYAGIQYGCQRLPDQLLNVHTRESNSAKGGRTNRHEENNMFYDTLNRFCFVCHSC